LEKTLATGPARVVISVQRSDGESALLPERQEHAAGRVTDAERVGGSGLKAAANAADRADEELEIIGLEMVDDPTQEHQRRSRQSDRVDVLCATDEFHDRIVLKPNMV
jgi:hypothetical protein